ncbi:hypothetical protein L484_003558 [Morus notabilis]|uniref:Uncharacterized protein n=1 Tax=Morus notabilis TaxID=981085 RepID=W9RVG2_9ROSA|nr:hypothetical protein L484_003558 [Morus notabilis]
MASSSVASSSGTSGGGSSLSQINFSALRFRQLSQTLRFQFVMIAETSLLEATVLKIFWDQDMSSEVNLAPFTIFLVLKWPVRDASGLFLSQSKYVDHEDLLAKHHLSHVKPDRTLERWNAAKRVCKISRRNSRSWNSLEAKY